MLSIDDIFTHEAKPKAGKDQAEIIAFPLTKNLLDQIKSSAKESQDLALIRELITAPRESGGHGESEESVISAYLEECRKNPDFMAAWLQDVKAWKGKQQQNLMPVSMPKEIPVLRRCHTCKHHSHKLHYCGGGREDLPLAYRVNHPLRKLPKDNGVTCEKWLNADSDISI